MGHQGSVTGVVVDKIQKALENGEKELDLRNVKGLQSYSVYYRACSNVGVKSASFKVLWPKAFKLKIKEYKNRAKDKRKAEKKGDSIVDKRFFPKSRKNKSSIKKVENKEKQALEHEIAKLRQELKVANLSIKKLASAYDEKNALEEHAKVLCPYCNSVIPSDHYETIGSGHLLVSCPSCKNKHAFKKDEVEVIIRQKKEV